MAQKKLSLNLSDALVNALLYIALGLLLVIFKAGSLNIVLTIVGVLFVIGGVVEVLQKKLVDGIVKLVIGLALIAGAWLFIAVVLFVLGALLIVKGALDIIQNIKSKSIMALASPVLTVICGILLFCGNSDILFIILGIVFIVNGALALFNKKL